MASISIKLLIKFIGSIMDLLMINNIQVIVLIAMETRKLFGISFANIVDQRLKNG